MRKNGIGLLILRSPTRFVFGLPYVSPSLNFLNRASAFQLVLKEGRMFKDIKRRNVQQNRNVDQGLLPI